MRRWSPVLWAAGVAVAVALLGASATDTGPWYQALRKPALQPPGWAFAPAWTAIYALTVIAFVLAWRGARDVGARRRIAVLFALNALLNVLWSELFFMARRPDWSLVETVPFWLSIAAMILAVRPGSRGAALLLLPYLLWVAFASWLNLEVVRLNPPFG